MQQKVSTSNPFEEGVTYSMNFYYTIWDVAFHVLTTSTSASAFEQKILFNVQSSMQGLTYASELWGKMCLGP